LASAQPEAFVMSTPSAVSISDIPAANSVGRATIASTGPSWPRVVKELRVAREFALEAVGWTASLPCPDFEEDFVFLALGDPDVYAIEGGRLVSSTGLDLAPSQYDEHVVEEHVEHSTALHSRLLDGTRYLVGPLARYALNRDRPSPAARAAADAVGVEPICRKPFRSIVVRPVEIVYALDEALRLLDAYEPPDPPAVEVVPRAGVGFGWTEAPRGMLWHRYAIDDEGTILEVRIVPPTSQNQGASSRACMGSSSATSICQTTSCGCAASRPCAATTRASRARRTSCAWRSTEPDRHPRPQRLARRRRTRSACPTPWSSPARSDVCPSGWTSTRSRGSASPRAIASARRSSARSTSWSRSSRARDP
jgi:hypothetical protein